MFHPTRGGTRGGAAEFKWTDVKADKDRENYLGHSINAPQGRWQNNKDIHWYNRNKSGEEDAEALKRQKARELKEIKMREENELSIALGYGPVHDLDNLDLGDEGDQAQGKGNGPKTDREIELEKLEAEEKRRRKELKREKKALKEIEKKIKKQEKEERRIESRSHRSRDRSPRGDRRSRSHERDSSASPSRPRHQLENDRYRHAEDDRARRRSPPYRESRYDDRGDGPSAHPRSHHHHHHHRHQDEVEAEPMRPRSSSKIQSYGRDTAEPLRPPARPSSSSRDTRRDGGTEYDFEAERARDRQRWERYHDREKGLREDEGWGRR